jgi:hypothetical protein
MAAIASAQRRSARASGHHDDYLAAALWQLFDVRFPTAERKGGTPET